MKIIGAFCIVFATSFLGFDMSNTLTNRTRQLKQLIVSLQMMEAEMVYSKRTLQQIFHVLRSKLDYPITDFYDNLTKRLNGRVTNFYSIWSQELESLRTISSLTANDVEILQQFGRTIGQHSAHEQRKHIQLTIYHLQLELDQSRDKQQRYATMLKTIGFLFGLLIVILLF
ncbi:MAG TPA: stage III sporulation protein SpoIIIAB [Pseudogracilibacillus sp.]|nr:stage III sporulation protein SpoIIIAB [Pseudogracilibacillus sp.]